MNNNFIRKLVEHAEGFELLDNIFALCVEYRNDDCDLDEIREWKFYPLLLYRAMEGFNDKVSKKDEYKYIIVETCLVKCSRGINLSREEEGDGRCKIWIDDYQPTDYLAPQEQALEAALIEVLE